MWMWRWHWVRLSVELSAMPQPWSPQISRALAMAADQ